MHIWIITVGEPLPIDGSSPRLFRTGILAHLLAEKGHQVLWWSSDFDHVSKSRRAVKDRVLTLKENLRLVLLHGMAYKRNVSLRRVINHYMIARDFKALSSTFQKPDIILTSYPTLELSEAAIRFGKRYSIPAVVDVRDLWPDAFRYLFPKWSYPASFFLMTLLKRKARYIFSNSSAVYGITDAFVNWGVNYAKRERSARDRAFPLGYPINSFNHKVDEALAFWKGLGITNESWNICYFGYVGKNFDLKTLILASNKLKKKIPQLRVIICGVVNELEKYQSMLEKGSPLLFPGWVNGMQIQALMRISKAGIAPYLRKVDFENSIPNKAIEYLSAGLPILTPLQGVLGQLLKEYDCGLLYREFDPVDLERQLMNYFFDPELQQRQSRNARSLFLEKFEAKKVYEGMEKALLELATV